MIRFREKKKVVYVTDLRIIFNTCKTLSLALVHCMPLTLIISFVYKLCLPTGYCYNNINTENHLVTQELMLIFVFSSDVTVFSC